MSTKKSCVLIEKQGLSSDAPFTCPNKSWRNRIQFACVHEREQIQISRLGNSPQNKQTGNSGHATMLSGLHILPLACSRLREYLNTRGGDYSWRMQTIFWYCRSSDVVVTVSRCAAYCSSHGTSGPALRNAKRCQFSPDRTPNCRVCMMPEAQSRFDNGIAYSQLVMQPTRCTSTYPARRLISLFSRLFSSMRASPPHDWPLTINSRLAGRPGVCPTT